MIRTAPASVIRNFYTKWYRPENMAVVVVGDFGVEGVEGVVKTIEATFAQCAPPPDAVPVPPPLPSFDFAPHTTPR